MLRRFIYSSFLLLFFAVPRSYALPSLDVSLDHQTITREETAQLQIQIEWAKSEGNYLFALPLLPLKNLKVTNHAESQETFIKDGAEWTRKTFQLQLTPSSTGKGEVESFAFNYINAGTQETYQFNVSPLELEIRKVPFKWKSVINAWTITPAAVILGIGILTPFLLRKRLMNTAPELSSQEKAVLKVREASEKQSFVPEAPAQFDRIFREFLADYYGIQTLKISENEIVSSLKEKSLSPDEIKTVQRLLERFKEMKFTSFNETDFTLIKRDLAGYIESKRVVGLVSS